MDSTTTPTIEDKTIMDNAQQPPKRTRKPGHNRPPEEEMYYYDPQAFARAAASFHKKPAVAYPPQSGHTVETYGQKASTDPEMFPWMTNRTQNQFIYENPTRTYVDTSPITQQDIQRRALAEKRQSWQRGAYDRQEKQWGYPLKTEMQQRKSLYTEEMEHRDTVGLHYDTVTRKWVDRGMEAKRAQLNAHATRSLEAQKAEEARIVLGYVPPAPSRTLADLKIPAFSLPRHMAGPDKFRSHQEYEQAKVLHQSAQALMSVSHGMEPTEAAARISPFNWALRRGQIPVEKMTEIARLVEAKRRTNRQGQAILDKQIAGIHTTNTDGSDWSLTPIHDMQTRAERLSALQDAQPAIEDWYRKIAAAASRRANRQVSVAEIRKFVPGLSHEQLNAIQSPSPNVVLSAGPGSGKSTTTVGRALQDILIHSIDPEKINILAKTHSAITAFLSKLDGVESIIPEWTPEKRQAQASTFDAFGIRLLNHAPLDEYGQRGITPLQRLHKGGYESLYKGKPETIEEWTHGQQNETRAYLARVFEKYGIDRYANKLGDFATHIEVTKGSNRDVYAERFKRGEVIFAQQNWKSQKVIHPDLAFYLYQQSLQHAPGFEMPGQERAMRDINDTARFVDVAAQKGFITKWPSYIIGDENQDASPRWIKALASLTGKTGRGVYAGDVSQMVVQRDWRVDDAMREHFAPLGASFHDLTFNYRTGAQNTSILNSLLSLNLLQGKGRSPFQYAMGGQDLPPQFTVQPSIEGVHRAMISDWMKQMATGPEMIALDMRAGNHPFGYQGPVAQQHPFVFQMDTKDRGAFVNTLQDVMRPAFGDDAALLKQFMQDYVTTKTPQTGNEDMLHALTIGQIRSREAQKVFFNATRGGLWDDAGYVRNLYTALSRAREQNFVYASTANFADNAFNLTPDTFLGQTVPTNFGTIMTGAVEHAHYIQGVPQEDMPGAYQDLLGFSHILHTEKNNLEDPAMVAEYAQAVLHLSRYFSPAVGGGVSGIAPVSQDFLYNGSDDGDSDMGLRGTTINAQNISGHAAKPGANQMMLRLALAHTSSLLHSGSTQPVPESLEAFMDQMKAMAGPLSYQERQSYDMVDIGRGGEQKLIASPYNPETLYPTSAVMPEYDLTPGMQSDRDKRTYKGKDDYALRSMLQSVLIQPEFRQDPQMQQELEPYYTHPNVLKGVIKATENAARKYPRMKAILDAFHGAQAPVPAEMVYRLKEGITLSPEQKRQAAALQARLQTFGRSNDLAGQPISAHDKRVIPTVSSQQQHMHQQLLQLGYALGPKQDLVENSAQERGRNLLQVMGDVTNPKNRSPLYNSWLAGITHEYATKEFVGKNVSSSLLHYIADKAQSFIPAPSQETPFSEEELDHHSYLREAARTMRMHADELQKEDGGSLPAGYLDRLSHHDPLQAAIVRKLTLSKNGGSLPLGGKEVERRVSEYPYQVGSLLRNINTVELGQKYGVPYHDSDLAPALTAIQAYHLSLMGGVNSEGTGIVDHQNVRALLRPQADSGEGIQNDPYESITDADLHLQSYGGTTSLPSMQRRLGEILHHRQSRVQPDTLEEVARQSQLEHQLKQAQFVRKHMGDKQNQRDWAQQLRIIMRATTGESVRSTSNDRKDIDPIRSFFAPRTNGLENRSLDSLVELVKSLQMSTYHTQQTGKLSYQHMARVIEAFGHSPQDERFGGLRHLEQKGFIPTKENPNPELPLEFLRTQFPSMQKNIQGQLTRLPVQPNTFYQFRGGDKGFGDITSSQKQLGITAGTAMVGQISPYEGMPGQKGIPFGLSAWHGIYKQNAMYSGQQYATRGHDLSDATAMQPLFTFTTQVDGQPKKFIVTPDQLSHPQKGVAVPARIDTDALLKEKGDAQSLVEKIRNAEAYKHLNLGQFRSNYFTNLLGHQQAMALKQLSSSPHSTTPGDDPYLVRHSQYNVDPTTALAPERGSGLSSSPIRQGLPEGVKWKKEEFHSSIRPPMSNKTKAGITERLQKQFAREKGGKWEDFLSARQQKLQAIHSDDLSGYKRNELERVSHMLVRPENYHPDRMTAEVLASIKSTGKIPAAPIEPPPYSDADIPITLNATPDPIAPSAQLPAASLPEADIPMGDVNDHLSDISGMLRTQTGLDVNGVNMRVLSDAQRAVLDSTAHHQMIQGGPGTGKTEMMVHKLTDMIAQEQVDPTHVVTVSSMHSGVNELHKRFNESLRPLLPNHPNFEVPDPTTIHALAAQIVFPGGKPSPYLPEIGRGHIENIMANPSDEELAMMTPEVAAVQKNRQYNFLRDSLKSAMPDAQNLPRTIADLKPHLETISNYKKARYAPGSKYDAALAQGRTHIAEGHMSYEAALAAYEDALPSTRAEDYDGLITVSRELLEQKGKKAIPPHLQGTQAFLIDEAQDLAPEVGGMFSALMDALGTNPHAIIGLDPMQSLLQGAGSIKDDQIIPAYKAMLQQTGQTMEHHILKKNFRSAAGDVALSNAILGLEKMKDVKGVSPQQVPRDMSTKGVDPAFILAKSQPTLYKKMFTSMLARTGVDPAHIAANMKAGNAPFAGVDWDQKGLTRPGQIPAIFTVHKQRQLFEHVMHQTLQDTYGLTKNEAYKSGRQMYRTGLPGKFATDEEKKQMEEQTQFLGLTVGQSRGLSFDFPHMDATRAGKGILDKYLVSYLRNLFVGVTRVKDGGQNTILAANHPFNARQADQYMATNGADFQDTNPDSLTHGMVRTGEADRDILSPHNNTTFETYKGKDVPHHFADIMGGRDAELANWGLADTPAPASTPVLQTPRVVVPAPLATLQDGLIGRLHTQFKRKGEGVQWPDFLSGLSQQMGQHYDQMPPDKQDEYHEIEKMRANPDAFHPDTFVSQKRTPALTPTPGIEPSANFQKLSEKPARMEIPDVSAHRRYTPTKTQAEVLQVLHAQFAQTSRISWPDFLKKHYAYLSKGMTELDGGPVDENHRAAFFAVHSLMKNPDGYSPKVFEKRDLDSILTPTDLTPTASQIETLQRLHYKFSKTPHMTWEDFVTQHHQYMEKNLDFLPERVSGIESPAPFPVPSVRRKLPVHTGAYDRHNLPPRTRATIIPKNAIRHLPLPIQGTGKAVIMQDRHPKRPGTFGSNVPILDSFDQQEFFHVAAFNQNPEYYHPDTMTPATMQRILKEQRNPTIPQPQPYLSQEDIPHIEQIHKNFRNNPIQSWQQYIETVGNKMGQNYDQMSPQKRDEYAVIEKMRAHPAAYHPQAMDQVQMANVARGYTASPTPMPPPAPSVGAGIAPLASIVLPPSGQVNITGSTITVNTAGLHGSAPSARGVAAASVVPPPKDEPATRQFFGHSMGGHGVSSASEPVTADGSDGGGKKPPSGKKATDDSKSPLIGAFNTITNIGRTFARIGGEMQFFGQLFTEITDQAAKQGSEYRRATLPLAGSGANGTSGYFNFTNEQSGIGGLQQQLLPMYDKSHIAYTMRDAASIAGSQNGMIQNATDVLSLGALTGMSGQELLSQTSGIAGYQGLGQGSAATSALMGQLTSLYGTNLTSLNVSPTLQALGQSLPGVQGLQLGGDSQVSQIMSIFKGAMAGGMTATNMPDVGQLIGTLSQMGSTPDLQQQALMAKLFPGQTTANVDLMSYQQQQVGSHEQLAQLNLQQNINGRGLSLPRLQIQIAQADIRLERANLDMAQLQQQYGQASYQENLNVQNALYGPIGADTSRTSYFDFMRKQMVAGYNPLSAETGTTFKSSPAMGIENVKFYADVEHQRQDLILSRSPLLSDAKFQENMKYLNKQEAFYQEELKLRNEQRAFEMVWQKRLLDEQGYVLSLQEKRYLLDVERNAYEQKSLAIQDTYLPQQAGALQSLLTAMNAFLGGQGPVNGKNITPKALLTSLAGVRNDKTLISDIQMSRIPLDQQNTLYHLIKGIQSQGGLDKIQKSQVPTDKALMKQVNDFIKQGAFTDQTSVAAKNDAFLNLGGTGATWDRFVSAFDNANKNWKDIANALSNIADTIKNAAVWLGILGAAAVGAGLVANTVGMVGGGAAGIFASIIAKMAAKSAAGAAATTGATAAEAAATGGASVVEGSLVATAAEATTVGAGAAATTGGLAATVFAPEIVLPVAALVGIAALIHQSGLDTKVVTIVESHLKQLFPTPAQIKAPKGKFQDPYSHGQPVIESQLTPAQQFNDLMKKNFPDTWGKGTAWDNRGTRTHGVVVPPKATVGYKPGYVYHADQVIGDAGKKAMQAAERLFDKTMPASWQKSVADPSKQFFDHVANNSWGGVVASAHNFWDGVANNSWGGVVASAHKFWGKSAPDAMHASLTDTGVQIVKTIGSSWQKMLADPKFSDHLANNAWGGIVANAHSGGGAGVESNPGGHQGFITPTLNADFGQKMNYGIHQGVDLAAQEGTPLAEFIGGKVINTGYYPWGGEVDVAIPGGLTERYLHLSSIGVRKGQSVSAGSPIGLTGGGTPHSGFGYWSSGSHSHIQYDLGNINHGINPWAIWKLFGRTNLAQFYGSTTQDHRALHAFATGGVAMRRIHADIGESEPEAIIPLSKLSDVLRKLPVGTQGNGGNSGSIQSSGKTVTIQNLIGNLTLNTGSGGGRMNDQEQDELMAQLMDIITEAARQLIGKLQ